MHTETKTKLNHIFTKITEDQAKKYKLTMKQIDELRQSDHENFALVKQELTDEIHHQVNKHTNKVLSQVRKTDKIVEDINRLVFQRSY